MKKKIGVIFLVLVMVLTLLPQQVHAEDAYVTVTTQNQLTKALKNSNLVEINISTKKNVKFTIPKGNYKKKCLMIYADNSTVINQGTFSWISIDKVKKYTESAKGNYITCCHKDTNLTVTAGANLERLDLANMYSHNTIVVNGTIQQIMISQYNSLVLSGKTKKSIPVYVPSTAKDGYIKSSVRVSIGSDTVINVDLMKGAAQSGLYENEKTANIVCRNKTGKALKVTGKNGIRTVASGKNEGISTKALDNQNITQPTVEGNTYHFTNRASYIKYMQDNGFSIMEDTEIYVGDTKVMGNNGIMSVKIKENSDYAYAKIFNNNDGVLCCSVYQMDVTISQEGIGQYLESIYSSNTDESCTFTFANIETLRDQIGISINQNDKLYIGTVLFASSDSEDAGIGNILQLGKSGLSYYNYDNQSYSISIYGGKVLDKTKLDELFPGTVVYTTY